MDGYQCNLSSHKRGQRDKVVFSKGEDSGRLQDEEQGHAGPCIKKPASGSRPSHILFASADFSKVRLSFGGK